MKATLITILFVFSYSFLSAQEAETAISRSGVSINGLGSSGLLGASYDILIKRRALLEIGAGYGGYGVGGIVFIKPTKVNSHNWYTGLKFNHINAEKYSTTNVLYVPFGAMMFYANGFYLGVDMGPSVFRQLSPATLEGELRQTFLTYPRIAFNAFGNLKVGFRFQAFGNK